MLWAVLFALLGGLIVSYTRARAEGLGRGAAASACCNGRSATSSSASARSSARCCEHITGRGSAAQHYSLVILTIVVLAVLVNLTAMQRVVHVWRALGDAGVAEPAPTRRCAGKGEARRRHLPADDRRRHRARQPRRRGSAASSCSPARRCSSGACSTRVRARQRARRPRAGDRRRTARVAREPHVAHRAQRRHLGACSSASRCATSTGPRPRRRWRRRTTSTSLPIFAVTVWSLYIRAQRWRMLLRPVGTPAMRTLVAATNIGFMANMVLPLRIGEVIRPVLVQPQGDVSRSAASSPPSCSNASSTCSPSCSSSASRRALVPVSDEVRQWGYRLCAVAAVDRRRRRLRALAGAAGAAHRCGCVAAARCRRASREPVDSFFRGFVQALEILDSPLTFLQLLGWSLYLWLVDLARLPVRLAGLRPDRCRCSSASIVVTAIMAIAVSAPSAPGFIGAFQFGCVLALSIFGVSESDAIAYSIVLHVTPVCRRRGGWAILAGA